MSATVSQIAAALTAISAAGPARIAKAAAIVNDGKTHRTELPGTWLVAASDGATHYVTTTSRCSCPDHAPLCKHQIAVLIETLASDTQPAGH